MIKPVDCTPEIAEVSVTRSYYQGLIKQYGHSKDCANQTILVTSATSTRIDSNQAVVVKDKEASDAKGETVDVSSQVCSTKSRSKELSVARSHSLRQREIEWIELENLMAKQDAEQQLRGRKIEMKMSVKKLNYVDGKKNYAYSKNNSNRKKNYALSFNNKKTNYYSIIEPLKMKERKLKLTKNKDF